jgi:LPXTG-motif cell wall-anchored protein
VNIADDMVPLGSMPKTGESNMMMNLWMGLALSMMAVAGSVAMLRRREN